MWFKVDDNLAFHHKVVAAGNAAMGLWVRAGALSAQQLTDGFVPDHMVATLGTSTQAEKLVKVGLWKRVPGGFSFHEWNERQPRREEIEKERAAARERMKAARERKRKRAFSASSQASESRSGEVPEMFGGSSGEVRAKFGNPDPTRPDPTRPEGSKEPSVPAAGKPRKKPATRLPHDWQPTDEHRNRAASEGINLDTQVAKFRAHADANDRRQVNWNAAFTQWLLNVPAWQKTPRRDGQLLDFPVNGTPEEKDAWARSRPMPTDGAYFGGSARPTTPQNGPESPTERPAHLPAGDRPRVTRSTPERRAQ